MCTGLIAGKEASFDKVLLVARNEDSKNTNWDKCLTFRQHPQYKDDHEKKHCIKDNKWILSNGLEVEIPKNAFSYHSIPDSPTCSNKKDTILQRYEFEARGINKKHVAISATNSMEDVSERVLMLDPFVKSGIEESIITTLLLPQAETAYHGVSLLGKYVEQYGASEGNAVLFADINEAWYMEIASGHHWIAVKVPQDSYIAVANGLRIHDIDLSDTDSVIHSKGLYEFVDHYHLLENPNLSSFNFAQAFGNLGNPYNTDRVWLIQKILTPSIKQATRLKQYPLFMKPDRLIKLEDVFEIMRSNYKNTVLENHAERCIGVDRTIESHVLTINKNMPDAFKGMIWQSISSPLGAPYMPIFTEFTEIPEDYTVALNSYAPVPACWAFRSLHAKQNVLNEKDKNEIAKKWKDSEQNFLENYRAFTHKSTYTEEDIKLAQRYSNQALYSMYQLALDMYPRYNVFEKEEEFA
ncbi:MAG: C69 family dipeptidase [Bacteroidales bacterium]|nr:C69 family dipeptidase [Bacteroidales bacterium]